ncbi:hypothetical protein cyc_07925 [Cyclospora cayetanensis]|uniref:THUMP domain-containing protein n=1 Tax=Cyclospora cayetanensis TaxID=88456 RepID=A0A1D3D2P7_9EIME|nr:hypothetical protein cyc_07925 [Cyclospora cayetanensis]
MEEGKRGGRKRGQSGGRGTGIISKRRKLEVGKSCKGVFLTCNKQPIDACKEFLNILDRYLEEYSTCSRLEGREGEALNKGNGEHDAGNRCNADAVAAGLFDELRSLSDKRKRFEVHQQLLPGVVFIRFTDPSDIPSEICHGLLHVARKHPGKYSCRYASRLLPVDVCVGPALDALEAELRSLCALKLPLSNAATKSYPDRELASGDLQVAPAETADAAAAPEHAETPLSGSSPHPALTLPLETWACAFSSRGFGTVKKEQVLEVLTREVGRAYKVDIANATDYGCLYRYNLHRCCHPEAEEESKAR